MQLGVVGMGRMGAGIARRLMRGGHQCVVWDRDAGAVGKVADDGATAAKDLADLVAKLEAPRTVWVMLPAGKPTEDTVTELAGLLAKGDIVIDGGNTFYRDDMPPGEDAGPEGDNLRRCRHLAAASGGWSAASA